jgi:SAM-dependent methyltransferase
METATTQEDRQCPLCGSDRSETFHVDRVRPYLLCPVCAFVYVPARWHVSAPEARERYNEHRNDPANAGYRQFLNRLVDVMVPQLPAGAHGLDFGSGPGPALSLLFGERGFVVKNYDPFYAGDRRLLDATYDFVACSETVEHFTEPRRDWELLVRLVRPGGLLGVMTERRDNVADFSRWRYINDKTHVGFYSKHTLEWLAARHGLRAEFVLPSVVLFRRRP